MTNEAALPDATEAEVSNQGQSSAETHVEQTPEQQADAVKPEKTEAERERTRMQRGIDRRTRQLEEARAESRQLREQLTRHEKGVNYDATADDSEPLSLTRAQVAELVKAEAAKLAPTLREEALEVERRQGVIQSLAKTWGQEKFDSIAEDLDSAFDGLVDRHSGQPKPAIEAVFEADNPVAVIEFLSNPDNEDEAEKLSRMSAAQAGKYIAKLEMQFSERPDGKPKASKAPAPLSSVRGSGPATKAPGQMTDAEYATWRKTAKR